MSSWVYGVFRNKNASILGLRGRNVSNVIAAALRGLSSLAVR